jgi:uncharacterized protein (TIGR01627 family)
MVKFRDTRHDLMYGICIGIITCMGIVILYELFNDNIGFQPWTMIGETPTSTLRGDRPPHPWLKIPESVQLTRRQVTTICNAVHSYRPNGNILVWGLGNDSDMWKQCTNGRAVFIEDDFVEKKGDVQWFDAITAKFPRLEAYKVHYTTSVKDLSKYHDHENLWDNELSLYDKLPESVRNEHWDVILIDAPLGCCNVGPGRFQSIFTSSLLTTPGETTVFLDNYERDVERVFSHDVFKTSRYIKHEEPGAPFKNKQIEFFV